MLILVIAIGLLYALPNLYGEDPAVQITGARGVAASETTLVQVRDELEKQHIASKSIALEMVPSWHASKILTFSSVHVKCLMDMLGDKYVIALNLAPATPRWIEAIGAEPMKLGLDLRGGVHFLMQVDMETALSKLQEQSMDMLRSDLREKGIPYSTIRKTDGSTNGVIITFRDAETRDKASSYLSPRYLNNLVFSKVGDNGLKAVMTDQRLQEARDCCLRTLISCVTV
jgi:preprotein translocase subunit SecD